MNSSRKDYIHHGVMKMLLCIAAVSTITQQNYFSINAFVPSSTIITHKSTSPTTVIPTQPLQFRNRYTMTPFMATTTSSDEELEKEINSMKAKDIREELQSYGISTKSFFEKSELVDALVAARKEGKTPIVNGDDSGSASTASSETTARASSGDSRSSSSGANRQERLQQEMEKCKAMKVGELKKELESYGVSTKSFFEKSEFVRAVAEARVDGVKQSSTTTGSSSSSGRSRVQEEPRDPSYRDVTVSKFKGDKALLGRGVIDVKAR